MSTQYWAFLSYSSRDVDTAKWLVDALETYRIPRALVGRLTRRGAVPARLHPVFRDRDELRSSPDLSEALTGALEQSRHLVVLCSPNVVGAQSWVGREIQAFKAMGRGDDIVAVIVDGEPNASAIPGREDKECFPDALRYEVDEAGELTDRPVQPLAADLRREDPSPALSRRKAFLKVVAQLIDVGFDELWQRDARRRRRRQAMAAMATVLGLMVLGGLGWTAVEAARSEASARAGRAGDRAVEDGTGPGATHQRVRVPHRAHRRGVPKSAFDRERDRTFGDRRSRPREDRGGGSRLRRTKGRYRRVRR